MSLPCLHSLNYRKRGLDSKDLLFLVNVSNQRRLVDHTACYLLWSLPHHTKPWKISKARVQGCDHQSLPRSYYIQPERKISRKQKRRKEKQITSLFPYPLFRHSKRDSCLSPFLFHNKKVGVANSNICLLFERELRNRSCYWYLYFLFLTNSSSLSLSLFGQMGFSRYMSHNRKEILIFRGYKMFHCMTSMSGKHGS